MTKNWEILWEEKDGKVYNSDIFVIHKDLPGTFFTSRTRRGDQIVSEVTCFCESVHPPTPEIKKNPWIRLSEERHGDQVVITEVFDMLKGIVLRKLVFNLKKNSEEMSLMEPVIESLSFSICTHVMKDNDGNPFLMS